MKRAEIEVGKEYQAKGSRYEGVVRVRVLAVEDEPTFSDWGRRTGRTRAVVKVEPLDSVTGERAKTGYASYRTKCSLGQLVGLWSQDLTDHYRKERETKEAKGAARAELVALLGIADQVRKLSDGATLELPAPVVGGLLDVLRDTLKFLDNVERSEEMDHEVWHEWRLQARDLRRRITSKED